jgi:hypothetical protein
MKAKFYKNFQIAKCFLFAFFIFHFSFFIFGCSSSSEISKGDLTGSVYLDGSDDHTGISVALYDLAYLDTTIVRINREYPHIGVIITQHTEFDHRLQSPVATSTTLADGSFLIEDVPTGIYNFVAQKVGYGFRYIYEISISEGDNEISNAEFSMLNSQLEPNNPIIQNSKLQSGSDGLRINNSPITLFEELHLSGDVNDNVTVAPFHHLVCDDDVTFIPGSSLEIQPNAVVRITSGADLKIMGDFKAQGEEDKMFWVTSNHGFENDELLIFNSQLSPDAETIDNSKLQSGSDGLEIHNFNPTQTNSKFKIQNSKLLARDSDIELYNSMSLESTASVQNDLIEWGKWDWGNTCLLNQVDNLTMQNGLFRRGECGYRVVNLTYSIVNQTTSCFFSNQSSAAIFFDNVEDGVIKNTFTLFSYKGMIVKDNFAGILKNCDLSKNTYGASLYQFFGEVMNCDFSENLNCDLHIPPSQGQVNELITIKHNNFKSSTAIKQNDMGYYEWVYQTNINSNNFYNEDYYFIYFARYSNNNIVHDLTNNFFYGLSEESQIENKIYDSYFFDIDLLYVDVSNFRYNEIEEAGIELRK